MGPDFSRVCRLVAELALTVRALGTKLKSEMTKRSDDTHSQYLFWFTD
jgi:hypothetical protein